MSVITQNVKRILAEKGLKQKHLAAQLGLSAKEMSRILSEGRPQPENRIIEFADTLGVELTELFKATDERRSTNQWVMKRNICLTPMSIISGETNESETNESETNGRETNGRVLSRTR
jgi:transcriptional regulator with XRE-family HTH domain